MEFIISITKTAHLHPSLKTLPFVAIDLETTGIPPAYAHIIEWAAIRFRFDGDQEALSSLVRTQQEIPQEVQKLTGIQKQDIEKAPELEEIWPRFSKHLEGSILIAHNAPFDLSFLVYNALRKNLIIPDQLCIDTLRLARKVFPQRNRYRISDFRDESITKNLANKISGQDQHRALTDAQICRAIFEKCIEKLEIQTTEKLLETLENIPGALLQCSDLNPLELEIPKELRPIIEAMKHGRSIYTKYKPKEKIRHIVPCYFYRLEKTAEISIWLKAFCLSDRRYKDYEISKLQPVRDAAYDESTVFWTEIVKHIS